MNAAFTPYQREAGTYHQSRQPAGAQQHQEPSAGHARRLQDKPARPFLFIIMAS
jgi:hypothetical protein